MQRPPSQNLYQNPPPQTQSNQSNHTQQNLNQNPPLNKQLNESSSKYHFPQIFLNKIKTLSTPLHSIINKYLKPYTPKPIPFNPPGKPQIYQSQLKKTSNQVLLHIKQSNQSLSYKKISFTYYVPAYIRLVIKNFTNIDHSKLQAQANVSILITFVYGNKNGLLKLPQEAAARLYNEVVLNFERDQSLKLTPNNDNISIKEKEQKSEITFTVRRKVHMRIQPNILYSPFEKLHLIFPITIQQLPSKTMLRPPIGRTSNLRDPAKYQVTIKFNFMDCPNTKLITIDYKNDHKNESNFGNYSLIENSLKAEYINDTIKEKRQEEIDKKTKKNQVNGGQLMSDSGSRRTQNKINSFQYVSFQATVYKRPAAAFVNIFLPLWGLAFINLVVYYQRPNLAQRIASIATLMVAFVALDDNIRIQIPPHPQILAIQYLVYAELLACILCLYQSYGLRNFPETQHYEFNPDNSWSYWFSCVILGLQIFFVILRSLYYYFAQIPSFSLHKSQRGWSSYKGRTEFNHVYWRNKDCDEDEHFKQMIQNIDVCRSRYNCTWTNKLEDLSDNIRRRMAEITFTYVKPFANSMINKQDLDMVIKSYLQPRHRQSRSLEKQ